MLQKVNGRVILKNLMVFCDSNALASVGWDLNAMYTRCVYEVADFQFVIHSIV